VGVSKKDIIINVSTKHIPYLRDKGFVKFVSKPDTQWFASWKDEVTQEHKYLFFSNEQHNTTKFDCARSLKRKLPIIRKHNLGMMRSSNIKDIQLGLAAYLIEHLCIRIGNELQEYDTIGACTLLSSHIRPLSNQRVRINFLGKDHIPFDRTVRVNDTIHVAINTCKHYADNIQTDMLFSCINPSILNRYLSNFHPQITAKVFRTCKASMLFQNEYRKHNNKRDALMKVAVLLNHKKMRQNTISSKKQTYSYNLATSWNNYVDHRIVNDPSFVF
jgi:DNA topoisomerase IB